MGFTTEEVKQNRADWITALRSGEYEQGTDLLNYQGKYCCLGVACDVLSKGLKLKVMNTGVNDGCVTYNGHGSSVPKVVVDALGLYTDTGSPSEGRGRVSLVELNDVRRFTFGQIADILDAPDSPYFKELS